MKRRIRFFLTLGVFFIALLAAASAYTYVNPPPGIPILAYHRVNDIDDRYSISPELFERQLQYLQEQGYTAISLLEFAKAKKGKFALPERPVIITFDDGYADNYTTAMPLLEKYGMKGSFFMVVNDIGRRGYLTLEELKEMESRQMEIGSHTANHLPLATLSEEKKREEINASKLLLEWKGLKTVFFLAYPNGSYDEECPRILEEEEYLGALTGQTGLNTPDTDPYRLHRINIPQPVFGMTEFKLRLFKADFYAKWGILQH